MQQQPIVAADVLEALLLALGTADTAVIGQAEADLRRALTKPAFIGDLLDRLQRSPNAQVRQLAAVLMRRKVGGHWSKLPPPVQAQLKASLLTHLAAEPERLVRRATAGVAAVVAKHTLPKGEWAELLAFVTACAAERCVTSPSSGSASRPSSAAGCRPSDERRRERPRPAAPPPPPPAAPSASARLAAAW